MSIANYTVQIATSSISLISSSTIAGMICTSPRRLTSPYRRIIFGLSIADIVQSLAILTGPFAIPKGTIAAPWSIGNVTTCNINGFMVTASASTSAPMYTAFLCIYYVCKLVKKMPDKAFARDFERFIHIGIFVYNISVSSVAFALQTYNATSTNIACHIAAYPSGCNIPESPTYGQCTRGKHLDLFMAIGAIGAPSICFIIIVICGIMLRSHAIQKTRQFHLITEGIRNRVLRERLQNQVLLASLYQKETIIQSSLYIGFFLLMYLLPFLSVIDTLSKNKDLLSRSGILSMISVCIFSLGGFFNIIIYCRPKVNALRRRETDVSWIIGLFRVIRAGGEIPDDDSSPLCLCFSSVRPEEEDPPMHISETINQGQPHVCLSDDILNSNMGMNGLSETFGNENVAFRESVEWLKTMYKPEPESLFELMYARNIELHDGQPVSSLELMSGVSIEEENNATLTSSMSLQSKSLASIATKSLVENVIE